MCVILDTNTFGRFRDPNNEDLEPVRKWLYNRNGKIAYSNTEKFRREWEKGGMRRLRDELMRAGKLKLVSQGVKEKENELKGKLKSDDEHIIALAMVAGIKVLVSYYELDNRRRGDKAIFKDFTNSALVGGKLYLREEHKHLLTQDTCP